MVANLQLPSRAVLKSILSSAKVFVTVFNFSPRTRSLDFVPVDGNTWHKIAEYVTFWPAIRVDLTESINEENVMKVKEDQRNDESTM